MLSAGLLVCLAAGLSCGKKQNSPQTADSQKPAKLPEMLSADASQLSRPFPSVLLKDLNDKIVAGDRILEGKKTVVLFISPTCEPCSEEVEKWKPYLPNVKPPFQVIGISPDPVGELALYAKEHQINFPVYSDPSGKLVEHFSLSTYPTVVGVTADRIVKFIQPGYRAHLSPVQYFRAF